MMHALTLLGYGHTLCGSNWGMRDETVEFCRMYYVLGGTCRYADANHNLTLAHGHLYLLPQYAAYSLWQEPEDPFFVLWQHVRVAGCCVRELLNIPIEDQSAQWHILRAVERLTQGTLIEDVSEGIKDLEQQLTVLTARLESENTKIFSPLDARLDRVWAYIHSAGISDITVRDMAIAANMERSYFSRLFKQQIGVSPQQWLVMEKLTEATRLLAEGKTVCETACCVGYADAKAFSRAFSQHMHIVPSEFRKSHITQP
jgi:AraC-like DNA-binding protein